MLLGVTCSLIVLHRNRVQIHQNASVENIVEEKCDRGVIEDYIYYSHRLVDRQSRGPNSASSSECQEKGGE